MKISKVILVVSAGFTLGVCPCVFAQYQSSTTVPRASGGQATLRQNVNRSQVVQAGGVVVQRAVRQRRRRSQTGTLGANEAIQGQSLSSSSQQNSQMLQISPEQMEGEGPRNRQVPSRQNISVTVAQKAESDAHMNTALGMFQTAKIALERGDTSSAASNMMTGYNEAYRALPYYHGHRKRAMNHDVRAYNLMQGHQTNSLTSADRVLDGAIREAQAALAIW